MPAAQSSPPAPSGNDFSTPFVPYASTRMLPAFASARTYLPRLNPATGIGRSEVHRETFSPAACSICFGLRRSPAARHLFSRRHQRPVRGIVKLHLELRRAQTEIRIPRAALAHIQQSVSRLRQNFARITEAQFQFLTGRERSREHHRHQIVPFSLPLRSFNRRVLDEVHRPPIRLDRINLQIARQLKQQRPFSSAANSNIHLRRCSQHSRRLHRRLNPEARNRGVGDRRSRGCTARARPGANEVQISKNRMPSFMRGCPAHNGSAPAASQNTSKPPSFLPSKCACSSGGNFRSGSGSRSALRRKKMTEVQQQAQARQTPPACGWCRPIAL